MLNPNYAMAHLDMIASLVDGKINMFNAGSDPDDDGDTDIVSPVPNVGVMSITGPLFKYDGGCGEPGYLTYGAKFDALLADSNIDVIILWIDSPGGQGAGLRTFAQKVKNSSKYTICFISDGSCCSAAYWIASQCNLIIASQPTDRIGSIGAYMILINFLKASENEGVPLIEVYSSLSSEKNISFREALKGKPEKLIQELDETVQIFIDDVRAARAGKLNLDVADPFKGADYMAQSSTGIDALSIGLIDEVGDFHLAIQRAGEYISQRNNPNFSDMTNFTHLQSLASLPGDKVDQNLLNKVNAELTVAGITNFGVYPESVITEAAEATAQLATATARIAELEGQLAGSANSVTELATANATIATLNAQIATHTGTIATMTTAATTSAVKITELNGIVSTQQARITELETGSVPPSQRPKKRGGDDNTGKERELNSWELKAIKKTGGTVE